MFEPANTKYKIAWGGKQTLLVPGYKKELKIIIIKDVLLPKRLVERFFSRRHTNYLIDE